MYSVEMSFYILIAILTFVLTGVVAECDPTPDLEITIDSYHGYLEKFDNNLEILNKNQIFLNRITESALAPLEELNNLNKAFDELNKTDAKHYKRLSDLIDKLKTYGNTNETVYRQDQQIKKLEPQLAELEKRVDIQSSNLTQLRQYWVDLGANVNNRSKDIRNYDQKYTELEKRIEDQKGQLFRLEQEALLLENDVGNVKNDNDLFTEFTQGLLQNQEALEEQISDLARELYQLKADGVKTVPAKDGTKLCNRFHKGNI